MLLLNTSKIKRFCLYCPGQFSHSSDDDRSSQFTTWIDEACRLNTNELYIDVYNLQLPLSLLTCKTLATSEISWGYTHYRNDSFNIPSSVYVTSLKILKVCPHYLPGKLIEKLICGCTVLVYLSVTGNFGYNKEIFTICVPNLKSLEVGLIGLCNSKIIIDNPNIEYLHWSEPGHSQYIAENLSSLVEERLNVLFDRLTPYAVKMFLSEASGVKSVLLYNCGIYVSLLSIYLI